MMLNFAMIPAGGLFYGAATFRRCLPEKGAFLGLQFADLALTLLAISLGLSELNPLMRYLVDIPGLLLATKVLVPLLIAWLAPGRLLLPSIVLLAVVAGWNIHQLMLALG